MGNPNVLPVPIECVFPEPVYPYAKIVALYPWKHPNTKFRVQVSKMYSWESSGQNTLSNSKLFYPI